VCGWRPVCVCILPGCQVVLKFDRSARYQRPKPAQHFENRSTRAGCVSSTPFKLNALRVTTISRNVDRIKINNDRPTPLIYIHTHRGNSFKSYLRRRICSTARAWPRSIYKEKILCVANVTSPWPCNTIDVITCAHTTRTCRLEERKPYTLLHTR
jgi:hypothetical protein